MNMKQCPKCKTNHTKSGVFCSRSCANSRSFTDEANQKKRIAMIGKSPSNKGKKILERWTTTKCKYCHNNIEHSKLNTRKYHKECWLLVGGGYREGSGVGKSGWYKGVWCDSSYELVWVIYQLDHNQSFTRNRQAYSYLWNNKVLKYYPDFIQNDNIIEIKGYINKQTKEKFKVIPNLIVLLKNDLKKEFEYVEKTYGKDFIKLYNKNLKL